MKIKILYRIFALIFMLLSLIFLTSCGKKIIVDTPDEIVTNSWEYYGEYGLTADLSFNENMAMLTIDNEGEHCQINGLCIIDEKTLIIIDNKFKKEFLFNYELTGTSLKLDYEGESIEFSKSTD